MSKFKVKVGEGWLFSLTNKSCATIDQEILAKIFNTDNVEYWQKDIRSRFGSDVIEFIPVPDENQPEAKSKELDLCEILKDAPKGLKLYSTIYGEVEFKFVESSGKLCVVRFLASDGNFASVLTDGRDNREYNGECTIFPSFANRDWSTFKLPYKLPVKGELCWTMSSVGNWIPRFATGEVGEMSGLPLFFACQNQKFGDETPYNWQPLSEIPEVLKNHLKLK